MAPPEPDDGCGLTVAQRAALEAAVRDLGAQFYRGMKHAAEEAGLEPSLVFAIGLFHTDSPFSTFISNSTEKLLVEALRDMASAIEGGMTSERLRIQ